VNRTPIEWVGSPQPNGTWTEGFTWNPLLGCRRVSPGCEHCYAERLIAVRMSKNPRLPVYHDIARLTATGEPQFTGNHRLIPDRLDEPMRTKAPGGPREDHEQERRETIANDQTAVAACAPSRSASRNLDLRRAGG
jgi:hypothetical protein